MRVEGWSRNQAGFSFGVREHRSSVVKECGLTNFSDDTLDFHRSESERKTMCTYCLCVYRIPETTSERGEAKAGGIRTVHFPPP